MVVKAFRLAFPTQRERFSWRATENAFRLVIEESGLTPLELLVRIDGWRRLRSNLTPWGVAAPVPRALPTTTAPDEPVVALAPASQAARDWAEKMHTPWDGEDV
jgi:hypothetical protein